MTAIQLLLGIPFLALWVYVGVSVFSTIKLMLSKGQISEEKKILQQKGVRIIGFLIIIYIAFALLAFFINHLVTTPK